MKSIYLDQKPPMRFIPQFGCSYLVGRAHEAGFNSVTLDNFGSQDITFILDNAQTSYKDDEVWLGIFKQQINTCHQFEPRFCLFTSYGSPTEGQDDPSPPSVLSHVSALRRVSITVSKLEGSLQIRLFFTREEFDGP